MMDWMLALWGAQAKMAILVLRAKSEGGVRAPGT